MQPGFTLEHAVIRINLASPGSDMLTIFLEAERPKNAVIQWHRVQWYAACIRALSHVINVGVRGRLISVSEVTILLSRAEAEFRPGVPHKIQEACTEHNPVITLASDVTVGFS